MEDKRRSKRALKSLDEGYWDCSVCTYRNNPEAFKCDMCDVRKGTSTRKPRLNAQLVAQQVAQQYVPPPKKEKEKSGPRKDRSSGSGSAHKRHRPPRLKNIDRSSATSMEVTVGNLTVIITDYKPKKERTSSTETSSQNVANSSLNSSSNDSVQGDTPDSSITTAVKPETNGETSTEES